MKKKILLALAVLASLFLFSTCRDPVSDAIDAAYWANYYANLETEWTFYNISARTVTVYPQKSAVDKTAFNIAPLGQRTVKWKGVDCSFDFTPKDTVWYNKNSTYKTITFQNAQ